MVYYMNRFPTRSNLIWRPVDEHINIKTSVGTDKLWINIRGTVYKEWSSELEQAITWDRLLG